MEAASSKVFKAMTWNIHGNNGASERQALRRHGQPDPEREDWRAAPTGGLRPEGFRRLRAALRNRHRPMSSAYIPEKDHRTSNRPHDCAGGQKEGIAILIRPRFTIRNHDHFWFPHSRGVAANNDRDFRRTIHAVSFTIGGHDFRAYKTHLDAHYGNYRGYQLGLFARMMNAHNGITIGGWRLQRAHR